MPLEVRELIIKATVSQDGGGAATNSGPSGGSNNTSTGEEQIKQTLEKILENLKEKNER
ncbi:MAG: hypothetical protein J7578_15325 [Chitinophagaceae bacterium]|nr:hypothetical protein [Chitinophagaceae bacterium]